MARAAESGEPARTAESGERSRTGVEGSNRARWEAAFGRSRLRDADFTTMSGIPLEPVYGPDGRRAARRVPVHPGALRVDVPLEALDDADVRRLRHGRGHELAVQGDHPQPAATASRPRSTCRRCSGWTPTPRWRRARSAGAAWPSTRCGTWRTSTPASTLGDITTSMTINSPAAVDPGDVHRPGRAGGRRPVPARRHAAERHPEGVPGPEGVRLPAAAVDATGARHHRLHRGRDAPLALDLDLRLPHPGGGLDGRRGAGLHPGQRVRLRRAGPAGRSARRRVRAPPLVLLQRPHRLLRGDRQVPRRSSHLGPLDAGALRRPAGAQSSSCGSTPRPPGCPSPRSSPR